MTPANKKGPGSGNCEALAIHFPEGNRIMNTVHADLEIVAANIRYGLARRGQHDASGLAPILNVTGNRARDLYSGRRNYTVRQLAILAVHFGVSPADLLDENLIVRAA